jgi:hypothetical protein
VVLVRQGRGNAKITEQDGAVVVDEEICCLDIPVNKSVDMQITTEGVEKIERRERKNLLEALEGLPEDAAYNLLFHATGPSILHDVCGTPCVHEAESDVQFMAIQPASSDTKNVRVLRKGHQLSFPLKKAQ